MSKESSRFKTLATLTVLSAGAMHLLNRSVALSSTAKNILRSDKGSFYHWKYGDVYYKVYGTSNKKLLLLHDLTPLSSGYEWRETVSQLSHDYQVYVVDLPGCGRSDKPAFTYVNYLYVQFLTSFIQDVIGKPASVVASGFSSSYAVMAANACNEWFSSLTLINPPDLQLMKRIPDLKSKLLRGLLFTPVIGTTLYYVNTNKYIVEDYLKKQCYANAFFLNSTTVDAYHEAAHRGFGKGRFLLGSLLGNYLNTDIGRVLHDLTVPVRIIYGSEERREPSFIEDYRKLNGSVEIRKIQDSKKIPQLEKPKHFVEALID